MLHIDEMAMHIANARILLMQDSGPVQEVLVAMLKQLGADNVEVTVSLSEGLLKIYKSCSKSSDGFPAYDLILMDMQSAADSVIEACEFVSRHPATVTIPLVMVSGKTDAATVSRVYQAGASDYLATPLCHDTVRLRLGTLLKLHAYNGMHATV